MKVVVAALAGRVKAWRLGQAEGHALAPELLSRLPDMFSFPSAQLEADTNAQPCEVWVGKARRVCKECIRKYFWRKKPCGIYKEALRCLCSWRYKHSFTKWVTGKCASKLFICLPKPLLLKLWIVSWHVKDRGMRCFMEAVHFSAAVPGAVEYAKGSYLSWVELLTSSS